MADDDFLFDDKTEVTFGSVPAAEVEDDQTTPQHLTDPGVLALATPPPGGIPLSDDPWVRVFMLGVRAGIIDIVQTIFRDQIKRGAPRAGIEAYLQRMRREALENPPPLPSPDKR